MINLVGIILALCIFASSCPVHTSVCKGQRFREQTIQHWVLRVASRPANIDRNGNALSIMMLDCTGNGSFVIASAVHPVTVISR